MAKRPIVSIAAQYPVEERRRSLRKQIKVGNVGDVPVLADRSAQEPAVEDPPSKTPTVYHLSIIRLKV